LPKRNIPEVIGEGKRHCAPLTNQARLSFMPTVLITGANRGLGLEFARQYAAQGWSVIAACRRPKQAKELNALARRAQGRLTIETLDVTDARAVAALARRYARAKIDLLINNAGVYGPKAQSFAKMDYAGWAETFAANTIAPFRIAQALAKPVAASEQKRIVAITSQMGSIADNEIGNYYAYRSSKAALNMVLRSLARDLAGKGVTVIALHPGWVRTRMGGPNAPLSPAESVSAMRKTIEGLKPGDSGRFLAYDGRSVPW
jgi:NAD(P)-dependent dehydrogenase (short-subunit alcohol dehydrogenase family)